MKLSLRALRRHHTRRLKNNRKNYYGRALKHGSELGKVVTTPQVCSCWGCGNQRFIEGETRQEIISRLRLNDEY